MQGALDYDAFDDLVAELSANRRHASWACNVAGKAVRRRIEALAAGSGCPLDWLTSSAAACGVSNGYDNPGQLGADRWAALIGARSLHAGAADRGDGRHRDDRSMRSMATAASVAA
jgi:type III pantothenate kinase